VARSPQQNGVAERKNITLIEAARTMLVDSLLSTTLWPEAVNTACYVQNRVLVTKPHNKTLYELLIGRTSNLGFMKPFGCPVTILNTLDHLGKFEGKADEGFLVGYSVISKAFRVFNSKTRRVEENLHIKFLENKLNIIGRGLEWLFDIDLLTISMNYEPVTVGNQTNNDAGIEINANAGKAEQEKASNHEYILLPLMPSSNLSSDDKDTGDVPDKGDDGVSKGSGIDDQDKTNSSTQNVGTAEPSINTASTYINIGSLNINTVGPNDPRMPSLEKTGIFDDVYDDREVAAEADTNNLELLTVVIQALTSPSWIEAMQEELLQFKLKKVWTLVDLPNDKRAIGTKWVFRNKTDENKIIIRNKARRVAQGLQVKQKDDGIFISQDKYVADILRKFGFTTIKIASTLMEPNKTLIKDAEAKDDGPHMPLLAPMLVVPTAGAAANVAAGPEPSSAPQGPTPVREPSPRPKSEPTPDSPSHPSPLPSSTEVGPTTSSRPPSPSRPPSGPADIREGGGDFASSPPSNEVPQTPAATAAGGAENSATLTALTLKLDECLHRVTTLENELGITKKVLGGAGEDATTMEQEFDLAALYTLASATLGDDPSTTAAGPDVETTMPGERTSTTCRRLRKPFTSYVSAHVSETIPPGVRVPAAATTIPVGSSVDADVHAAAAPSSSIPTAAYKGKAPMVDNSPPTDLLSEHERVLKNLYDSQLGEDLAKKIQAEQEAEFASQQENAAHLIYTEANWLDLLAKIATNSALSKELLGDDVTEENMNERLGMLLMHDPLTASEHGSSEPTVAAPTPSSSRHRRKHIAKKLVTPIVDVADAAMIKFDSDSDSDDDPLPYAPYAGWEMVPSPLGSVHAYHNMAGHTKHFTTLREILHMVERTDLQRLLGDVDALYQSEEPDTFTLLLWGDLHVLFQSLDDTDALHFWRTQDSWRIRSWRLYPRAQVHVLEMVDGRVIHMFVDVSYPLSVGTLERMLKHGLEVSKLLVGGDLTMVEQLIGFIKAALLNARSAA
nr:putative ribonuclease H-like domain-containing protein [Tanacetum cinerariifolium]